MFENGTARRLWATIAKRLGAALLLVLTFLCVAPQEARAAQKVAYDFEEGVPQGTKGSSIYWDGSTLTLDNATITRSKSGSNELIGIRFNCDATIVLIGENKITVDNADNDIYGAINMQDNDLTITGSPTDNYNGSLVVSTGTSDSDDDGNAAIYNIGFLKVENVRYLGITAGRSKDHSSYGIWAKGTLSVEIINSSVKVSATSAHDYAHAFYSGDGKNCTINLTNSSLTFESKSGQKVIREKGSATRTISIKNNGDTTLVNKGNPTTGAAAVKDNLANAGVYYHYVDANGKEQTVRADNYKAVPVAGTLTTVSQTPAYTPDGYKFIGWSTAKNGTDIVWKNGKSSDVLKTWKTNDNRYDTATYANDTTIPNMLANFNSTKTSAAQKSYFTSDSTIVNQLHLFAVYEPIPYTLTYKLGGGTLDSSTADITVDDNLYVNNIVTLKSAPTREGYRFEGWKCFSDNKLYKAGGSFTMPAASVTMTAQWTAVTSVKVTKEWNDGNNQDGKRPTSVTVQLQADGKDYGTATLNADNWTYTWNDLDKYKSDGKTPIEYTVRETNVPTGYTPTVAGSAAAGFTITNSHTPATTSVKVTKVWSDNDNCDNIRPNSVTVQLYANNKAYGDPVSVTSTAGWTYTWTNLPKYNGGATIKYTVAETILPQGYTPKISGDATKGYTITNTHIPETTSVEVTKVWSDNNNAYSNRPTSIRVQLYADGVALYDPVTLSADSNWGHGWSDLTKNSAGKAINYTVKEISQLDAYNTPTYTGATSTKDNKTTRTITNTLKTTSVTITKAWRDSDDQDGIRPDDVDVYLYATGEQWGKYTLTADSGWTKTVDNLPVYKNGTKITYTVDEITVPTGYTKSISGLTITNSHTPETIDVTVTKNWAGDSNNKYNTRPESITVKLSGTIQGTNGNITVCDPTKAANQASLSADANGNWTYTWSGLPKYNSGKLITYTVSEEEVTGYTATVNGFTITNTLKTTDITVTKDWYDEDNQDGIRPDSVTVYLCKLVPSTDEEGEDVPEAIADGVTLNKETNWTYTYAGLPKYDSVTGDVIQYTFTEAEVEGYEYTVDGTGEGTFTIYNSHTPETIGITATVEWDDNNNQDGIRPNGVNVTFTGVAGSKTVYSYRTPIVETNNGTWSYTWSYLDKYSGGEQITYSIRKDNITVNGYTVEVTGDATNGFVITCTHNPATTNVKVTKVWSDGNNQDGLRPDSVTVQLYADGAESGEPIILTAADGWTGSWASLPKYSSGTAIVYTVDETSVPEGYSKALTGTVADGFTITNSYDPETTSISGSIVWDDRANQDGIRPDSVTLCLVAYSRPWAYTTATADDGWCYTFADVAANANGQPIAYTVVQQGVTGYTTTVSGYDITNAHTPATIGFDITMVWDDADDADGLRPDSVIVRLLADGEEYSTATMLAECDWEYSWENLDKYAQGEEITYTITEDAIEGYTSTITGNMADGFTITNRHTSTSGQTSGSIAFAIKIVWDDNDNAAGARPECVSVALLENGATYEEIDLDSSHAWSVVYNNMPEYRNGKAIAYTVKVLSTTTDYTYTVSGSTATIFTVTATYTGDNGQTPAVTTAAYTVNHYKQNADGKYALADAENLTGTIGNTVTATAKTYEGYTYNATASTPSALLEEGKTVVLSLYYDLDTTDDDGNQGEDETPTVTAVTYTVNHYKQTTGGQYTLASTETWAGTTGSTATATAKTYEGYTYNAKLSTASALLEEGKTVVLSLYYDLDNGETLPQTGDATPLLLWSTLLLAGIIALPMLLRKKHS